MITCYECGWSDTDSGFFTEEAGKMYCSLHRSLSMQELSELTHETQVERFGFCTCEEQEEFPYDDCPREMGACDVCQTEYETGSQIDHCGECGVCWNHCVKHEPYGVKDSHSLFGIKEGYEDHA